MAALLRIGWTQATVPDPARLAVSPSGPPARPRCSAPATPARASLSDTVVGVADVETDRALKENRARA